MPLFFLLSGLFVGRGIERGAGPFITSRLVTIAYPYFLWTLIQAGLQMAKPGGGDHGLDDLLRIPWVPLDQFWFLYALFWGQLILLLLHRSTLALVGAALISLAVREYLPGVLGQVTYALPYLVAGMVLADRGIYHAWADYDFRAARALALPILLLTFALAVWWGGETSNLGNFDWPSFPATLLGILLVLSLSMSIGGPTLGWLRVIGRASMALYLLHIIAASGIRFVLQKLGGTDSLALHLTLGTLAGLLIPLAAHGITRRLGLLTWAGLGVQSRR
jgi:fucose 4-O-acetylase-like acetyltransferase